MLRHIDLICLLALGPTMAITHHGSAFYCDLDKLTTIEVELSSTTKQFTGTR